MNRLLSSLPTGAVSRLRPDLELVPMGLGQILHRQRVPFEHVFFPITAVVTQITVLASGASGDIGMIGNEGMVGTSLLMESDHAGCLAVVHIAGEGYRLKIDCLRKECERSPKVLHLLLRYVQALLAQTAQSVVCSRYHSVDQQLCRWLLLTRDRVSTNKIHLTHELIAKMVGLHRPGITAAAGRLRDAGVIQYDRGVITVINRRGLKTRSCECYKTVKRETDRLVPTLRTLRPSAALDT